MLKKFLPVLLTALVFTAGCKEQASEPQANPGVAQFKVALLLTGPRNDGGWNESAFKGLGKIHDDLNCQIEMQENLKPDRFQEAFRDYANRGFDLVIGHGDEFADAASKTAAAFPKVHVVTTGGDKTAPNLMAIHIATEEGNYLQGMEAAFVSKTGKGGFIGGQKLPPVDEAAKAFQKGALAVNPKFDYAMTYINSWDDPAAAKTQTLTLLSNGADVLSHNCDAAAKGMFDTAGDKPGVYTFGVNADENSKAPNVFSSAVSDIPKIFDDIARSVHNNTFKGGAVSFGMKDGDVALVDNPKFASVLTPAQKAKIEAAKQDIIAGKTKL